MTRRRVGVLAAALLLGEYLLLSFLFDVEPLKRAPGLGAAVGWIGTLAPIAVVGAAAWFAFAMSRRFQLDLGAPWTPPPGSRMWATLHGVGYVGLCIVTGAMGPSSGWATAWLAAACLTFLGAVGAVGSWASILHHARRALSAVLLLVAVTLGAFGLGLASKMAWPLLTEATLSLSALLLVATQEGVILESEDNLLGLGDFVVHVSAECSGLEGMGLMIGVVSGFIIIQRKQLRLPAAWIALPAAVLAVLATNVVRIAVLVWIGGRGWPDVALGGFHSKAGWVLFSAVALTAVAAIERVFGDRQPTDRAPHMATGGSGPFLVPLLVLIGTSMLGGLFSSGLNLFMPFSMAAGALALVWAIPRVPPGTWSAPASPLEASVPVAGALLAYAAWMVLVEAPDFDALRVRQVEVEGRWLWIAARALGSVAVVPVAEELAFRGFLLRRVERTGFDTTDPRTAGWKGLVVSSVAFGLLHQDGVAAFVAGAIYGVIYLRTGRLLDATLAHAGTNALIAVNVVVQQAWWLWI